MALGVTVDINANLLKLDGQIDKALQQFDRMQGKVETVSQKMNRSLSAIGVGLSAAGIVAFVKNGIDAADALNDMADRTGIAVEKLAGFQLATKLADTDLESFAAAANKLSVNIGKNAAVFEKLGITAKDPAEAFLQLADVFSQIEDPQKRAALGAAALGKSYAEMAPLLMQGSNALRQQIADGQKMSGITAEQAKAAADFNDKLDTLNHQLSTLGITATGPVLTGLVSVGNAIKFAAEQAAGFHPIDFSKAFIFGGSETSQIEYFKEQLVDLPKEIEVQRAKIEKYGKNTGFMSRPGGILGYDVEEEKQKLNELTTAYANAQQKLEALSKPAVDAPKTAPNNAAVNDFIAKNSEAEQASKKAESAAKAAADAEQRRAESIRAVIDNLNFEISLTGQDVDQQKLLSDIRNATNKATEAEAAAIEKLIRTKYDLLEADQIIADGEKLAAKQRSDMASEYDRLNQKFNGDLLNLNSGIGDALDARAAGIIPDDNKLKAVLDKMGRDYNGLSDAAGGAFDQMSIYAEQAGKDSQQALANFLFDPFGKSVGDMGTQFLNTIKKMAADAAAANIMEGLFGKNGVVGPNTAQSVVGWIGKAVGGALGGMAGSAFGSGTNTGWLSGVDAFGANASGRIVSSAFADGGIMTSQGPLALKRYANGGIANSPQLALFGEGRMNEAYVPLPDGRSIPVTMRDKGQGAQVVNHITMNISTPNADSFRRSERQIREQMQRAVNV